MFSQCIFPDDTVWAVVFKIETLKKCWIRPKSDVKVEKVLNFRERLFTFVRVNDWMNN